MILEFIIFAVLCLFLIAKLLNDKWKLEVKLNKEEIFRWVDKQNLERWIKTQGEEIYDLQDRLGLAGKNYLTATRELKNKIEKLEIKAIDLRNTIRTYQERDAKRIDKEVKSKKKVNLRRLKSDVARD